LPRDEDLAFAKAMEPARIALQRRISSDSVDSFGIGPNTRVVPVRKGKRKGAKKFTKTKVENIKGDELRSPYPISEGIRHSDRTPEKRVRVLRDDINANGIERKKRLHRGDRLSRRTRSLSPQTLDRQNSANDLLKWKPMELLNVAEHAGIRHNIHKIGKEEGDESSLGSLIDAIEADFGGQHDMSKYHQSAPCLSSVPLFSEDDPENDSSFRFSPDADALLSTTSGKDGKDAPVTAKRSRKASIGKDLNNTSTGTLTTENSTLSTSFEDAAMDLFTGLKPQTDPPSTLNPPSGHDRTDSPRKAKKNVDSPKKKRNTRPKETVSVASDDSQWLELVLPRSNEKNVPGEQSTVGQYTVDQSTVGDVKAYKADASGTINSMNSEEVKEKMKEGLLGKSLSALDVQDLLSPTKKKDFLRATTHCSPTQVSKHTGLSSLSAHASTSSSSRSNSSAYLLERLPLNPPIASDEGESSAKKTKKSAAPKRKSNKGSDVSVDESVEVFQSVKSKQEEIAPSLATAHPSVDSTTEEAASRTARVPRRGRRPGKNDADGLSNTLAQISPHPAGKEKTKKTSKTSDATLQSVEIFTRVEGMERASDEVSTAGNDVSTDGPGPAPSSDITTAGTAFASVRTVSRDTQPLKSLPLDAKGTSSAYSEGTSQMSSSSPSPRKNPPARPWSGRSSFADDSLVSSIKELSEGPVEEESMLNVLITSLKKDQSDVEENGALESNGDDQNEPENVAASTNDNTTKRRPLEEETKTPKKDEKINAAKETKSPKPGKKKIKARSLKSSPSASPSKENDQAEPNQDPEQEAVDAPVISPSPPKTPQSQKTRKGRAKSVDVGEIAAPPLTTPRARRKKETNATQSDGSAVKEDSFLTEDTSPRRRLRTRKTGDESSGAVSKGKKSPAKVRPAICETKVSGKKTPTRVRPSAEDQATSDGTTTRRKTPTRQRPGTEGTNIVRKKTPTRLRSPTEEPNTSEVNKTPTRDRPKLVDAGSADTVVVRKKTPTRVRNPTGEANSSDINKTPTRIRPQLTELGNASAGNRTPTRTRGEGGKGLVGKRTPTRTRPVVENGGAPERRKTPTRLRSRPDDAGATHGKKTPTRVRPGLNVSSEAPTCAIPGFESTDNDGQREKTLTKVRPPAQLEPPCRIESPVRTNEQSKENGLHHASNSVPEKQRLAPDPPAATHGLTKPSQTPDPPATTRNVGDTNRQSTPTRVRRIFYAATERVASACRTPPRERGNTPQSPGREGKSMRERSFSPFSRLRMLGSRTPPRQRLIDESEEQDGSHTPSLRVSQSPPKERTAQNESDSLLPIPVLDSLSSLPERSASRGRRRSSSSVPRKSEDTSETAVSQIRQNSIGSQNSLASKTRNTTIPKRKIGIDSVGSAETDEKHGRTKTPTRVRGANNGSPVHLEAPKKVSIRPRRRGGSVNVDRESSSGTALSEKPSPATPNNDDNSRKVRKRTPTRGRQPTRTQTPTKTRKKRLVRGSSEKQLRAPDPPGVNNSKLRAQSATRIGRSNSQPRPRNGEHHVVVPVSSQSLHVEGGPSLADFFD